MDDWDMNYQYEEIRGRKAATFLTKSFSESGHAEKMAETLCSYIPFPPHVKIKVKFGNNKVDNIYHIKEACKPFSNLQKPVQLTVNHFPYYGGPQGSLHKKGQLHIKHCTLYK